MQENHAEVLTESFKLNVDNYEGPLDLMGLHSYLHLI